MNRIYKRLLQLAGAFIAAAAFGPALAQINNVTDGTTTSTTCTSYTFSATGVLTFSPAGCLGSSTPPPATPTISFQTNASSLTEPTVNTDVNIVVRRLGQDLTAPGSVTVRWTGGTAVAPTNFLMPQFGVSGTDIVYTINFAAATAGTTEQTANVIVTVVPANLPAGATRTVGFVLQGATGGNLGATINHTFTINSAQQSSATDTTTTGAAIPEFLPTGTYASQLIVCELFQQAGIPGPGIPGAGGQSPCGGYPIPVTNTTRPAGAYNCNAGMANTTVLYGGGIGNVTHTVNSATMFVFEDLKNGNTYIPGVDLRYPQHQYNAFVMKFRTGGAGEFPAMGGTPPPNVLGQYTFGYVEQGNRGQSAPRFAVVSTQPCDFDYAKLDAGNACYRSLDQQGGGALLVRIVSSGDAPGYCTLQPNTTYYLSTRWENPAPLSRGLISCRPAPGSLTGQYCGTSLAIN